jgi:hypothetical protein
MNSYVVLAKTDKGLGLINKMHNKIHGSNEEKCNQFALSLIKPIACLICINTTYAEHIEIAKYTATKISIGHKYGKEHVVVIPYDKKTNDDHYTILDINAIKSLIVSLTTDNESTPLMRNDCQIVPFSQNHYSELQDSSISLINEYVNSSDNVHDLDLYDEYQLD